MNEILPLEEEHRKNPSYKYSPSHSQKEQTLRRNKSVEPFSREHTHHRCSSEHAGSRDRRAHRLERTPSFAGSTHGLYRDRIFYSFVLLVSDP